MATATPAEPYAPVHPELAEAAIVEHYPRLVRLAYLILHSHLPRDRRVVTAHALVQRALPRHRFGAVAVRVPGQFTGDAADRRSADPGYAYVRLRVVRAALAAGRARRFRWWPRRGQLPPLLPRVWGLRLVPRTGGVDQLVLDHALAKVSTPGRAAFALRGLERLGDEEVRAVLAAAGVAEPRTALAEAKGLRCPTGAEDGGNPLESPEFDPCLVRARPTDLLLRRQRSRAVLLGAVALAVCGSLIGLPEHGWRPGGSGARASAEVRVSGVVVDPRRLTRAEPGAWRLATRTGFGTWPARGARTGELPLLRRALRTWARPTGAVRLSVTPGTASGPPPGPPQLLYAGDVDRATVVVLYDGLRLVRYAEPRGTGAADRNAARPRAATLDLARVDASDTASASALVVGRSARRVRFLTAPWVRGVRVRDLLVPRAPGRRLAVDSSGVTAAVPSPAARPAAPGGGCGGWEALQLDGRLVTDLGEVVPARLTYGVPVAPGEVAGAGARAGWARSACRLGTLVSRGVRSVNTWRFAAQPLPDGSGVAEWSCTRAETWRGTGGGVLTQFQPPGMGARAAGTVTAAAEDAPECGPRVPRVLAGVRWRSRDGRWYVLAAGSPEVVSVASAGQARGSAAGRLLAVPTRAGAHAELRARLMDGRLIRPLR
ncbi:hypothetical protein ACZ90_66385 [Streptomyces albus subsp. albus]|nr:hypothetical protein ACZ90_66385 [Streptomyces albus subsp. albus]